MTQTIAQEEIYGSTTISTHGDCAVSVKKTRIIFRCKNKACKHTWAKEYRRVYQVMPERNWSRSVNKWYDIKAVYEYQRLENGKTIRYEQDYTCPECGQRGESNIVVGTYSEEHKCGAKCRGAKNGACECQCGGSQHGIAYMGK